MRKGECKNAVCVCSQLQAVKLTRIGYYSLAILPECNVRPSRSSLALSIFFPLLL
jgi:hypothetical protein